ncbi:hypothetical protein M409DRAFT_25364 [Zasmidium cellare ATCC 36951]|uniref:SnoaL-like domain-containing protein n=1 Tax=Zasmidium cellare ATCC 36951 TaxID=1080233 RepID=A0A6A6CGD6_ZASCE|nr:uncharacterized protein M409DRAFT_25364 [Zasmidium cellare ATCC 36951]KAF2164486.1 hypothetical protein M409DRAFT_25364 [Zasmidium cellare ATCC 36951]
MSFTTPESLKARGLEILRILCVDKAFDKMPGVLDPNVEAYHDDEAALVGRDNFISHFQHLLTAVPTFSYQIYDSVAELDKGGKGGRVWIFSRLLGLPKGIQKDTVDMFDIDGEGRLVRMKDVQRLVAQ